MIPRYSRPEMTEIWEPENKFRIWFEIEAHACDALAELGVIPKEAAKAIWERGKFDVARIDEIERETKHDVIAFLTNVAEHVGPEARFLHQGMTSSDVLDTCLAVQLKQAADILLADLDRVLDVIKRRAYEHKETVCIGRSHGIHAEPTTFGIKLAGHFAEFDRNLTLCAGGALSGSGSLPGRPSRLHAPTWCRRLAHNTPMWIWTCSPSAMKLIVSTISSKRRVANSVPKHSQCR